MSREATGIEQIGPKTTEYGTSRPEKKKGFLRRHKVLTGLGGVAVVAAAGIAYVSTQEQYATNDCSDLENVQVDVSAGRLSGWSRTLQGQWNGGSLKDVAAHVSETRGYYVNPEAVVELNPKYSQFADKKLASGVYCLALPAPQIETVGDTSLVMRTKPENLAVLLQNSDGSVNAAQLAAVTQVNADAIVANDFTYPETGYYPIDSNLISWISEEPAITLEAINRTKSQAQELGLIGQ